MDTFFTYETKQNGHLSLIYNENPYTATCWGNSLSLSLSLSLWNICTQPQVDGYIFLPYIYNESPYNATWNKLTHTFDVG